MANPKFPNEQSNPAAAIPVWIAPAGAGQLSIGFQAITGLNVAKSLTVPADATVAVISPAAQAVRYRDDGVAPTSTVGVPLAVNQSMSFYGQDVMTALQFIEQAASATLNVIYY